LEEARKVLESWRIKYNTQRRGALHYKAQPDLIIDQVAGIEDHNQQILL